MLARLTIFALTFALTARAAITILYPTTDTIWYKNNTVTLNWTISDPQTDTYLFRTYLFNTDQSLLAGNHSIADSTNATAQFVRILLTNVPAGQGYTVSFVNTTNEAQVFATSEAFEIANGEVTNSTTTASSTTATSSSSIFIPNSKTTTSSSFTTNPFATAQASATSKSSSSGSTLDTRAIANLLQGGMVLLPIVIGMGITL
ncbi:hypothetical protein I307_04603 [Cryptococcus deuterogattii 99/473]|uniref:Ser-Thr-rich glycosyl-phosphatidyl-inositol-anchored membrane family-domain-containing protein n=2 Tax=Cryptococcus deuterogattii TaxID=1859096 RepID=A0A0D0V3Q9_9TREE|nr:hypothetical protein CNBG_2381 [Cryptococcus deuterogattii R265]KIR27704.1 hypothetical protein I309_03326 [Cryptococcus deuterogattii LA55]KIR31682.1 hypothetical protein I352_06020 [Cryptococcus deuterogattii MMRL2647]KIR42046.1 hypothetical protein I313_02208 [Cryptococcus deuterogattii Ram5]KIR73130.1 hypothetical protein I310_02794 [Cryptococcus deuterogattii CA1014]KIR90093.1 hypothetical protein I304_06025 [Cryptococcus deuterogattii CBS 10090]KIR98885.1 hypothetical protein L804_03